MREREDWPAAEHWAKENAYVQLSDLRSRLLSRMAERMSSPSAYASMDPAGYEKGRQDVMAELLAALDTLEEG